MDLESLQGISLAVNRERSPEVVLERIVGGLAAQEGLALARVWLVGPGEVCDVCRMRTECPGRVPCLQLVASAGRPKVPSEDWSRLDGEFRRFPLGVRKVGRVGATGESLIIRDVAQAVAQGSSWVARPQWAIQEGIQCFAGHPLVFRGQVLGVLGVFSRAALEDQEMAWLRMFADHAAVAIANARAFDEIERLRERLEHENNYLREEVRDARTFGEIVGQSPALRKVLEQVKLVGPTDASVLLLGESGTGKELLARAIHAESARREQPLIKVNCASIPRELFESEFFGHVRGAFTGALKDRRGRFQLADGGTLFLDEVGEIPLDLQSKLLRVLQEGTFERVGEEVTRKVDVRVIAATHQNLKQDAAAGRFRADLYYRLSVFPVEVPPLRERLEDLPTLATHFVKVFAQRLRLPEPRLTRAHLQALQRYPWPGNIRELQHVLERALIVGRGRDLVLELRAPGEGSQDRPPHGANEAPAAGQGVVLTEAELRKREKENLEAALAHSGGRIHGPDGAAALLGIKPTTLASRLKAFKIDRFARR